VCVSMVFGAPVPVELLSSCLLNCGNIYSLLQSPMGVCNQSTKRNNFSLYDLSCWLQKLKMHVADTRENSPCPPPFTSTTRTLSFFSHFTIEELCGTGHGHLLLLA
jgi:hypothetical protein